MVSMKFAVVTYGTVGDARPLAALSRALIDAGHEARLLADAATLDSARALRVPALPLTGDIRGTLGSGEALADVMRGKTRFSDTAAALARMANANTADWMRETVEAARGCDAVIVSALASFVGLSVAECLGVPSIGAGMIPITPTADFPSPFLPPGKVPRWLNRVSHRFVNAMIWRGFRASTNAARASVCALPPRKRVWSERPMLYGVSPSLLPEPADWPSHARVCGQWNMPQAAWEPPGELAQFLAAGEAPIYVGFGSMGGFDRQALATALVAAVGGRRALFYPGWSGIDASALPSNFFVVGETPHDWLFPRTSMVVHHGGSGTTHSATRAGVPSVVVPFVGDQFFWADRLAQCGVAAPAVDGKRPSAAAFARAMDFAAREDVRARAKRLGAEMEKDDGLRVAVAAIEEIARR
jgi:UDP:flavonoid glycosyltransferase YjiC (YdhE family)